MKRIKQDMQRLKFITAIYANRKKYTNNKQNKI